MVIKTTLHPVDAALDYEICCAKKMWVVKYTTMWHKL